MFEKFTPDNDKRGQVGIGTLIVFIAMVLVAAIAAGVLVNTAGLLQSTAEDTGEQSIEKVTNRVEIVNAYGVYDGTDIDDVHLTVRLAAGSDPVDLNDATIRVLTDDSVSTITYSGDGTSTAGTDFGVSALKDDDTSMPVFNDKGDRFDVLITTNGLVEGETVELEITTKTGGTAIYIFTTPDSYAGKDATEPIAL